MTIENSNVASYLIEKITEEEYLELVEVLKPYEERYKSYEFNINTAAKMLGDNKTFIIIGAAIALDEENYKKLPKAVRKFSIMKDFCYICNYKVAKYHSTKRYCHYRYLSTMNFDLEVAEVHENYLNKLTKLKLKKEAVA